VSDLQVGLDRMIIDWILVGVDHKNHAFLCSRVQK